MNSQSGFQTSRDNDRAVIEFRPKNVLSTPLDADTFELEVQIPEEASYEFIVAHAASGNSARAPCKLGLGAAGRAGGFYDIETTPATPLRCAYAPGDQLNLRLEASWKDTKGGKHAQLLVDGSFVVPPELDLFGAPGAAWGASAWRGPGHALTGWQRAGYRVYVPNLDACAYLGVGNVIDKATGVARLEVLSFHINVKLV